MGTCHNCNTQISLGEGRTKCDVCGEVLFYNCNYCKKTFEVEDKSGSKRIECKTCGYFNCPHCGVCSSSTCKKFDWEMEILKILRPEITTGTNPILLNKVRKIVAYIENEKISIDRKICPQRKVPISYAKTKIKSLLAKMEGFRVKDEEDQEAFNKRIEEISDISSGKELTVNSSREKGSYGQEYRDAFNLLVCFGKLKIEKRKFKKGNKEVEYDVFVRCENNVCPNLSNEDLIINECTNKNHKGDKKFPPHIIHCPTCKPYSKGKEKGQLRKLNKRLSDKDSCQVYRGSFNKK